MSEHVTLAEAATFLGVSKATLRNWDKSGKLKAVRHPINDYRVYNIGELRSLREQMSLFDDEQPQSSVEIETAKLTPREIRRIVSRLHNVMRDTDANSSLVERFDELTKLLFLALHAGSHKDLQAEIKSTQRNSNEYAQVLRKRYTEICQELPFSTPTQFQEIKCSDIAIHECGKILSLIDLSSASIDVKGLAYEEMIKKTFDKTDNQQFFTPSQIVGFMVDFLDGTLKGAICDPASGTGGFLVEVAKRTNQKVKLTGFEIDERLAWVTGINTYLHGGTDVTSLRLEAGGTLGSAALNYQNSFDFIITNPPFGSDFSDEQELNSYRLGQGKTSRRRGIMFIERCHQLLKTNGRLAIIIDEGVLNLPHAQDVREFILDVFDIEGIVSLPESAFMPYASVNASILFLKKPRKKKAPKTFFARAERVGRKSNGDDDVIYKVDGSSELASDLPNILKGWRSGETGAVESEFYYWADVSQYATADNGYRLDFRFHHPSRGESRRSLEGAKYPLMTIGELCTERKDTLIPSKEMADSVIPYTGLAHIESHSGVAVQTPTPTNSLKSSVKRYESGDILFARMRPNLRKAAFMDFDDGGYTSPECVVLTPRQDETGVPTIDPRLLSVALRSDLVQGQITHLTAGIGRPRLNTKDLRNVLIPVPPKDIQDEIARAFSSDVDSAKLLRAQAERLKEDAQALEDKAVSNLAVRLAGRE